MAATNFCEMYDCRTTEFFRIDRFSDIFTPYHFKFIEVEDGHSSQFNMSYLADGNDWRSSATNKSITPGHGFPLDTNDDGLWYDPEEDQGMGLPDKLKLKVDK